MQLATLCSISLLRLTVATSSSLFVSAESAVCRQRAQQESGHIRHHLIAGHQRSANAGLGRNPQVLSRWAVRVIFFYAFLSPFLSHKLTVFFCRFVSCNAI